LAALAYPLLLFLPAGPDFVAVILVLAFAGGLSVGSVGLHFITNREHPGSRPFTLLAAGSNVAAGVLFVAMALVQLAIKSITDPPEPEMQAIYWGLDVAWDLYIGVGTLGFAIALNRDPWFGRIFAISGVLVSTLMLAFNIATFPDPPGDSGLIDLGPLLGIWYLAVTLRIAIAVWRRTPAW
jgi:hypothetical protein